jgi:YidC/Oxa1 family membrane protein insertase
MEDPNSGAIVESKTWGDAFKKGLFEGLIVFPVAWLLITFTSLFGGSGVAKVLSISLTSLIIKLVMLIFTFKQQIQTQKLQAIQPQLTELSKKLNDPNITATEKNRISAKMMEIYQKSGINPLSTMVPTLISMPIFICVWQAVNQTLVIRTGTFLGIELGAAVSSQVFGLNLGAIILFILMSGFQILSIKLPEIIRKRNEDYKTKQVNNSNNDTMKTTMNIMMIMILVTGFLLPAAIAIYWIVGAIFTILQTLVFQNKKVKEKLYNLGNRKKKAKVVQ